MKAAIYARVSTANNGQSVEMQLRDLRQLAQQRGFEIVAEFCDEGVSGAINPHKVRVADDPSRMAQCWLRRRAQRCRAACSARFHCISFATRSHVISYRWRSPFGGVSSSERIRRSPSRRKLRTWSDPI